MGGTELEKGMEGICDYISLYTGMKFSQTKKILVLAMIVHECRSSYLGN